MIAEDATRDSLGADIVTYEFGARPCLDESPRSGLIVSVIDEMGMTNTACGLANDKSAERCPRKSVMDDHTGPPQADFPRRQRLAHHHEVMQAARAGQARLERQVAHVVRFMQQSLRVFLGEECKKRLGGTPAHAEK